MIRDGKIQKLVETQELLVVGQSSIVGQVSKNLWHFSIILVEHYVFPFLQKEAIQNVVKGPIMLEVQGP